ncbi:unnamed protein product [Pleuronectes platessa]|uniref:Uncharacterized protein n=1 Tax=Pleuronectes platessa TaxID=8262 RepID=A0A9N7Z2C7_PLEPL|nr:unnamed protein product [Pleuronectes platessa]
MEPGCRLASRCRRCAIVTPVLVLGSCTATRLKVTPARPPRNNVLTTQTLAAAGGVLPAATRSRTTLAPAPLKVRDGITPLGAARPPPSQAPPSPALPRPMPASPPGSAFPALVVVGHIVTLVVAWRWRVRRKQARHVAAGGHTPSGK